MRSAEIGRRIIPGEFLAHPAVLNDEEDIFANPFPLSRKVSIEFGSNFADEYVDTDIDFLRYATELLGPTLVEDTVSVGFIRDTSLTRDMFPELSQKKPYPLY